MRYAILAIAVFALAQTATRASETPKVEQLADVPIVHEEAMAAGINSVYDGPFEFFVGGGGAALDCDGSGYPSVFLAGGKNTAKLYVNRSTQGGPLKFEERPILGEDQQALLKNVVGAYPLDIDGDGIMDLVVLRVGGNLLLKGGPKLHVHGGERIVELRSSQSLGHCLCRPLGDGTEISDARLRLLHRPPCSWRTLGYVRGQRPLSAAAK